MEKEKTHNEQTKNETDTTMRQKINGNETVGKQGKTRFKIDGKCGVSLVRLFRM